LAGSLVREHFRTAGRYRRRDPYTEKLRFQPGTDTADPDQPVLSDQDPEQAVAEGREREQATT
jgi:hypothetical protein